MDYNPKIVCQVQANFITHPQQILQAEILFPSHSLDYNSEILCAGLKLEFSRSLAEIGCDLSESDFEIDYLKIIRSVVGSALEYSKRCSLSSIFGDKMPKIPTVKITLNLVEKREKKSLFIPFENNPN